MKTVQKYHILHKSVLFNNSMVILKPNYIYHSQIFIIFLQYRAGQMPAEFVSSSTSASYTVVYQQQVVALIRNPGQS